MPLSRGSRFGSYEILGTIGAGGMGEVYRATDTNLGRQVALKVLPEAVAADDDRLARFDREAKTLAALNHPNIAQLYGLERVDGQTALIMELVEGRTLDGLIAQGPIPPAEAIHIATQIGEGLAAAHELAIIHRDLKPANVKVRDDGTIKVLDFGLAKAIAPAGAVSPGVSQSPTITTPALTQAGLILGTAAYMSPEQARGKRVDARSDIWAFGAVLYEMLTGSRAFDDEDVSLTLSRILQSEPAWERLPVGTPARVRATLRACLQKDVRRRPADIRDVLLALQGGFESNEALAAPEPPSMQRSSVRRTAIVAVCAAAAAAALAGAVAWSLKPRPLESVVRFRVALPDGQVFTQGIRQIIDLSPDGAELVYVANGRLFVRKLADLDATPISGIEEGRPGPVGIASPTFSPDGRWVAYSDGSTFKKIAISGGTPITLGRGDAPWGMSWSGSWIVYGEGADGIWRLSADGGPPESLVKINSGEVAAQPQMLPGGDVVLFTLAGDEGLDRWPNATIVAYSLRSGERKTVLTGGSAARYLPTGHLVYAVAGTLFVAPFDVDRLEVTGPSTPAVQGVRRSTMSRGDGSAQYAISKNGVLAFVPGAASGSLGSREIISVNRQDGAVVTLPLPRDDYGTLSISPTGEQIALDTDDGTDAGVWVYDVSGDGPRRRLELEGRNRYPVWSADGDRVMFQSDRDGDRSIWWQRADGSGTAERLTSAQPGSEHVPESVSGNRLSFSVVEGGTVSLWTVSLTDREAARIDDVESVSPFNSAFSPDGRWLAYTKRTPSSANVYVESFPAGSRYPITTDNGHHPIWLDGGRALSYRIAASVQVLVPVKTTPSFSFGNPVAAARTGLPTIEIGGARPYDATPDGAAFLTTAPSSDVGTALMADKIDVVFNWFQELEQLDTR